MLLTAGSIFLAGCSGNPSHGNGQGVYQGGRGVGSLNEPEFNFSNIADRHDFDIGQIERDFDFNSSQLGSDVTFDFGEDGNRDDREQLPTPAKSNKQAAKHLQKARQNLVEAIDIYASFGGAEADITSVSPTTESFSLSQIQNEIQRTRKPLVEASKSATEGQKVWILALEQVGIFLKHAAQADAALQNALSEYHTAIGYLEDGNTTTVDSPITRQDKKVSDANEAVDIIQSETDGTSMQIIHPNVQDMYEAKITQLETLIDSFRSLSNAVEDISDGLAELERGVSMYADREYDGSEFRLDSAAFSLQKGRDDIKSIRSDGILYDATAPGFDLANTLYKISNNLQQSAQAKLNYNDDAYTKYREQAIEHLESDKRTRYMQEINQIQW
jgi:hypothetical protein